MTPSDREPPRFPQRLLERLGGRRAAYMLGDLNEEFNHYALDQMGYRRARLWYWRQAIRSLPSILFPHPSRSPRRRRNTLVRPVSIIHDLSHAVRGLLRAPAFSVTVVLMLGIGVGVGASIFSLIDVLLLRAPPGIQEPENIRRLAVRTSNGTREFVARGLAWIDYEVIQTATTSVDEAAAWFSTTRSLGRGFGARNISVMLATPSFFTVLGAQPALGRFFLPEEDYDGANPVPCVASHHFWTRELERAPDALGRELIVGQMRCVVIGVAAPEFSGASIRAVDLWMPLRASSAESQGRDESVWTTDRTHWLRVIARMNPGISEEVANQEATAAYRSFSPRRRDRDLTGTAEWESIIPGHTSWGREVNIAKLLFAASVLLLLLIAINIANLMVVREFSRARETAIRIALGSPTRRLFFARVWEAGMLSLAAGGLGVLLAVWLGPIVRTTLLSYVNFAHTPVTTRVTLFTIGLAMLTGVTIAAVASMRSGRANPAALLSAAGSARSGGSRGRNTTRMVLVGVQAALSVALLVGSFAFVASFRRAANVDIGFDRHNVIAARATLSYDTFSVEEQRAIYEDLWRDMKTVPGVENASLGYMTPWWNNRNEVISIPGRDSLPIQSNFGSPAFDMVTPDYLVTMQLTMRSGRWISDEDRAGSAPVVVINEALGDLYWPGENPIGRCMRIGRDPATPCREVVGVVGNHAFTGALSSDPVGAYFLPYHQSAEYGIVPRMFIRMNAEPTLVMPTILQLVQGVRPNLPAPDVLELESSFEPLIAPWRVGSYAFTALGLLATAVGTFGLYSILSYVVTGRKHEFSVRAAIGGSATQIAGPVITQGLITVLVGALSGWLLAFLFRGALQPLLFETNLTAPGALMASAAVALSVALLATILPARNASRNNPLEALRNAD